jgi:hypothetical protein
VTLAGCVVIAGGIETANQATELVALPAGLFTMTEYPPAFVVWASRILSEEFVAPPIEFVMLKYH